MPTDHPDPAQTGAAPRDDPGALIRQLATALRAAHARVDPDGFCLTCHEHVPCAAATLATRTLEQHTGPADTDVSPLVRAAIIVLDQFATTDPEQAMALLSSWPHYDDLTAAQVQAILARYRAPCAVCGEDTHTGTEDHGLVRRHPG